MLPEPGGDERLPDAVIVHKDNSSVAGRAGSADAVPDVEQPVDSSPDVGAIHESVCQGLEAAASLRRAGPLLHRPAEAVGRVGVARKAAVEEAPTEDPLSHRGAAVVEAGPDTPVVPRRLRWPVAPVFPVDSLPAPGAPPPSSLVPCPPVPASLAATTPELLPATAGPTPSSARRPREAQRIEEVTQVLSALNGRGFTTPRGVGESSGGRGASNAVSQGRAGRGWGTRAARFRGQPGRGRGEKGFVEVELGKAAGG